MASALYTQNWVQLQNLGAGHAFTVGVIPHAGGGVPVITDITAYCGNPNAAVSNSIVVTSLYAEGNNGTLWGYNSGITESLNPIFQTWSGRIVFDFVPQDPNPVYLFLITNTVDSTLSTSSWDITIAGWWLAGGPAVEVFRGA